MNNVASDWLAKHPPGTKVRAAIYARRSLGKEETYSPDNQIDAARKFCQDRGWDVGYVIVEDDARADFYRRPKWMILLLKAVQKRFDVLVTWKLDRGFRSTLEALQTEQFLARHDIALTSVTEPFDTTTQFGRFSFRNIANYAELERGMLRERIRGGYAGKRRRRRWANHKAPLGYRTRGSLLDPPVRDYTLERCPQDLSVIELVWTKYERLLSAPAVADELNDEGLKTKHGGVWDCMDVYHAIDNPLYIGRWKGAPSDAPADEALRLMSDDEYERRQKIRHRRVVLKPTMSEARRRQAIDNVFRQYKARLEVDGLQEAAAVVDDVEGVGDSRLDPALVRRIMGGEAETEATGANAEEDRRRETRRRRQDMQWRKDLAQVLTL